MKSFRILLIGLLATTLLFLSVVPVGAQGEEPPDGEPQDEELQSQNPVVVFLAAAAGMTSQEIADLQQQGYGLGNISKALRYRQYLLDQQLAGIDVGEVGDLQSILAMGKGMGWGQLFKQAGMHPGGGVGWLFKAQGQHGPKVKISGWTPPGLAKKSNVNGNGWVPPGQLKNKDKNADKKGKK